MGDSINKEIKPPKREVDLSIQSGLDLKAAYMVLIKAYQRTKAHQLHQRKDDQSK